jgi:hypothetical protein
MGSGLHSRVTQREVRDVYCLDDGGQGSNSVYFPSG